MIDGPQGKSLDEYLSSLQALATDAFAEHRIIKVGGDRWVMRGNNGSMYWVEILWLEANKLLVHGDICAIIFAYASRNNGPRDLVAWMGRAGLDHAKEKAIIGTGHEVCEVYDSDLAVWELRRIMSESIEFDDQSVIRFSEEVEDVISTIANGTPVEMALNVLYEVGFDTELLSTLGRVIAPRVVYAQAAVKRLDELLTQKEKEEEHERRTRRPADGGRRDDAGGESQAHIRGEGAGASNQ